MLVKHWLQQQHMPHSSIACARRIPMLSVTTITVEFDVVTMVVGILLPLLLLLSLPYQLGITKH